MSSLLFTYKPLVTETNSVPFIVTETNSDVYLGILGTVYKDNIKNPLNIIMFYAFIRDGNVEINYSDLEQRFYRSNHGEIYRDALLIAKAVKINLDGISRKKFEEYNSSERVQNTINKFKSLMSINKFDL